jgi:hypothetical protein
VIHGQAAQKLRQLSASHGFRRIFVVPIEIDVVTLDSLPGMTCLRIGFACPRRNSARHKRRKSSGEKIPSAHEILLGAQTYPQAGRGSRHALAEQTMIGAKTIKQTGGMQAETYDNRKLTTLAPLGERVARNRRFHQPGRDG